MLLVLCPQRFNLTLSMGATTWILDAGVTKQIPSFVNYTFNGYRPSKSSTFKKVSDTFDGDKIDGWTASDMLSISEGNLSSMNQTFGVIGLEMPDKYAFWFMLTPMDGAVGIALSKYGNAFLDALGKQLDKPIITIWQERTVFAFEKDATVTYGGFDTDNCDESTLFFASNPERYLLAVQLDSFAYAKPNSTPKHRSARTVQLNATAKVDMSFGTVCGPRRVLDKLVEELGGWKDPKFGYYVISCSNQGKLPDLTFHIDGHAVTYSSTDYFEKMPLPTVQCLLSFTACDTSEHDYDWILGSRFFNSHCAVLDFAKKQVGFAVAK